MRYTKEMENTHVERNILVENKIGNISFYIRFHNRSKLQIGQFSQYETKLKWNLLTSIPRSIIRTAIQEGQKKISTSSAKVLNPFTITTVISHNIPENNGIPEHNVVIIWRTADASRRVLLQPLEIPHQSLPCWRRHLHSLQSPKFKSFLVGTQWLALLISKLTWILFKFYVFFLIQFLRMNPLTSKEKHHGSTDLRKEKKAHSSHTETLHKHKINHLHTNKLIDPRIPRRIKEIQISQRKKKN